MKSSRDTTKKLNLKLSSSFEKAIIKYYTFKSETLEDIEHAKHVVETIFDAFYQI